MAKTMPVQTATRNMEPATIAEPIHMAAYEVYSAVHGPQKALIEDGCRGGFSCGELIGFLYARAFPKEQWRARVDEAFHDMNVDSTINWHNRR